MNIFLYAGGFLIGVISFLYIGSFLRDTTEVINKKRSLAKQNPQRVRENKNRKQFCENLPINQINPGLRICPFCRSELSRDEPLYASRVIDIDNDENKILIH